VTGRKVRRVAVVGAASQIGHALLPRLAAKDIRAYRIGRGSAEASTEVSHKFDEQRSCFNPNLDSADAVISLAPLPTIGVVLKMAEVLGAKRVIAFGSTGRFTKAGSSSAIEQNFVDQQERAERLFSSESETSGIAWTLLRPTMIYGADADQNVAFIKSVIRNFGFFPMPWGAKGLRQPVHVDDLAAACVSTLECEPAFNRAYNLGGGEVLSFPELVRRIFRAERKRLLLFPVPMPLYYLLIAAAKKFPKTAFVREEMVERMFQDLTTDNKPACVDFGYNPRAFSLNQRTAAESAG
jgi:nucleoside-diphosphate-sugar epimerase